MRFEDLQARRAEIYAIATKYGVENIRVFGSVARGEADAGSDVDFLVNFPAALGLFDVIRFRNEVADALGIHVDLLEEGACKNPIIWEHIARDARPL